MTCECGHDREFEDCCGRFLAGVTPPSTCEELVRSRFVAFGLGNFDYIEETQIEPLPQEVRERKVPEWERLEIVSCLGGGEADDTGVVEFKAYYRDGGIRIHHETSRFVRRGGEWRYSDGDITEQLSSETGSDDAGRACPCGSGRKYRRCCGVVPVDPESVPEDEYPTGV